MSNSKTTEAKTTAARKPGARYRAAVEWADAQAINEEQKGAIWELCGALRYSEIQIVEDSNSIAKALTEFADRALAHGALYSRPTNCRRYQELDANILLMEAKIEALFSLVGALLGTDGKDALRAVLEVK